MTAQDYMSTGPTIEDLRKQLRELSDQINHLSGFGLDKATDQIRARPLEAVLIVLGVGLIGGYLMKRLT